VRLSLKGNGSAVIKALPASSLIVLLAVGLLVLSGGHSAASASVRGDANCSGAADARDALDMMLSLAGEEVTVPEECAPLGEDAVDGGGGDVNCDGTFDLLDVITSLKMFVDFPVHPCLKLTIFGFGAVGAEIGAEGGTLTTTGLDGTDFTLDIPQGALLGPEQIKMTPVDAIPDLPVPGGFVAAVDLQPSGLEFWDAVTLTIEPPAPIDPHDQTPFVLSDGEFVLHPLVLESAEIQLPLTHFSAAGLAKGPPDDLPPLSSPFDRYTAAAAALVLPQRAQLLNGGGGDPQFAANLAALMDDYYYTYVEPELESSPVSIAGPGDCPLEIQQVSHALGLAGQGARIGRADFTATMAALGRHGSQLSSCRQADFNLCVQSHDLGAISRIFAYSRVMTMLGIEASPSPLAEMIRKCAHFELVLFSEFCTDQPPPSCAAGIDYEFVSDGAAEWSMKVTPSAGALASVLLILSVGDWNPHRGCQGEMTSDGSTLTVVSGGISMNSLRTRRPRNEPRIQIVVHPGIPLEKLTLTCESGTDVQEGGRVWWFHWCSYHQGEITPPLPDPNGYCLDDQIGQSAFAIRRTGWQKTAPGRWQLVIRRSNRSAGVQEIGYEDTIFVLDHMPLP